MNHPGGEGEGRGRGEGEEERRGRRGGGEEGEKGRKGGGGGAEVRSGEFITRSFSMSGLLRYRASGGNRKSVLSAS